MKTMVGENNDLDENLFEIHNIYFLYNIFNYNRKNILYARNRYNDFNYYNNYILFYCDVVMAYIIINMSTGKIIEQSKEKEKEKNIKQTRNIQHIPIPRLQIRK